MPKVRPAAVLAAVLLAAVCLGCAPGDPNPAPLPGRPAQQEPSTESPAPSAAPEPAESPAPAPGTQVSLADGAGFGPILVDSRGRTLYLYEGDTSTQSTCYGECATRCPPLTTTGFPVAGAGVDDGLLGVGKRTDGVGQVLYKGHPLYYFAEDTVPGEAGGQQLDQWYVVNALGDKVTVG